MKAIELRDAISEYLIKNGTESTAKLVSNAIDNAGAIKGVSVHETRKRFVSKIDALSRLDIMDRK